MTAVLEGHNGLQILAIEVLRFPQYVDRGPDLKSKDIASNFGDVFALRKICRQLCYDPQTHVCSVRRY